MVTWQFSPRPGNSHERRREAIKFLRPLLSSARLVQLFGQIGMLAVTKPEALRTIEAAVHGLVGRQATSMSLTEDRRTTSTPRRRA